MAPEDRLGAAAIFQLEGALVSKRGATKSFWLRIWFSELDWWFKVGEEGLAVNCEPDLCSLIHKYFQIFTLVLNTSAVR